MSRDDLTDLDVNDLHRKGVSFDGFEDGVPLPDPNRHSVLDCTVRQCATRWLALLSQQGTPSRMALPGGIHPVPKHASTVKHGKLRPIDDDEPGPAWNALGDLIGAWQVDRVVTLVGSTGKGKSAFGVQAALSAAMDNHPVLYASAEMGQRALLARCVALRSRVTADALLHERGYGLAWSAIQAGRVEVDELASALDVLARVAPRLHLWAPPRSKRTGYELQRAAVALAEHHKQPPFVVLDYVHGFTTKGDAQRAEVSDLSTVIRELSRPGRMELQHPDGPGKDLAIDWGGACVLALSSTARSNYRIFRDVGCLQRAWTGGTPPKEGSHKPKYQPPEPLEGLGKESGELEYDAPIGLVMTSDPPKDPKFGAEPRDALVVVAKNRHGPTGQTAMTFWPACGAFTDRRPMAPPREPDGLPVRRKR